MADRPAGYELTADDYNTDVRKIVARGERTSNKTPITAEVGVLRIDAIRVVGGHLYVVESSPCRVDSTTNTDAGTHRLRLSTSGAATTSSAIIGYAETDWRRSTTMLGAFVAASDSDVYSVLLTVQRQGAGTMSWNSDTYFQMWVTDLGEDPGNTGVVI